MNYAVQNGIINLDYVRNEMNNQKRKAILGKHPYKIWEASDGRWKTYIFETKKQERKMIAKKSKEELEEEIIKWYTGIEDSTYIKAHLKKENTLRDIYKEWLSIKMYRTNASSYIKRINNDWNKYYKNDSIVDVPIGDLTYLMLDEWAHKVVKANNLTKKSYYNLTIIVRQCLEYAVETNTITSNPFVRVKIDSKLFLKKKKPQSETQVFVGDESELICKLALEKFYQKPQFTTPLAIVLNFRLGLRVGELMALKWSDISGNYLHIQRMETACYDIDEKGKVERNGVCVSEYTKSAAGDRQVYLNQKAREILKLVKKSNIEHGYYDDGYIFVNNKSKRTTTSSINKYLYSLCEEAGIKIKKSSHKIRKTYLSSLFDTGINVNTIREIAGHEDERTSLNNYCFDTKTDKEFEKILDDVDYRLKIADSQ